MVSGEGRGDLKKNHPLLYWSIIIKDQRPEKTAQWVSLWTNSPTCILITPPAEELCCISSPPFCFCILSFTFTVKRNFKMQNDRKKKFIFSLAFFQYWISEHNYFGLRNAFINHLTLHNILIYSGTTVWNFNTKCCCYEMRLENGSNEKAARDRPWFLLQWRYWTGIIKFKINRQSHHWLLNIVAVERRIISATWKPLLIESFIT